MGPECKGTGIATVKPMVTPRSVETKSMCFFRKSWISRRQSWEETDTPCSTAAARGGGGGFVPPTVLPQPQIEMEARGAHSIARLGCSVGSSPFFLLLAATWEDKHLQYFQLLQYAYDFLGMMRFGLWGMCARTGKCGHAKAFFFPPTGKRKEGNEKTEKQSTP